ncbi:MAG: hypothetical protein ACLGI5_14180 [Thermoleophilia bacterium]
MTLTVRLLAAALTIAAIAAPAAAHASPKQMSIMMDDDLLLYRSDSVTSRALAQMKTMGVDTVRVTVLWRNVAERARPSLKEIRKLKGRARSRAKRQRKRFEADDPRTYPRRNWDRYDNLVKAAAKAGLRVYFNVTGPGPSWAHRRPPRRLRRIRATYKPRAGAYKLFVKAVGRRFDGSYRDENGARDVLPRVSMWSLWNEPNQAGWLSPQWEKRGSRWMPAAPAIFRRLVQLGYEGLVATGHRADNDIVLLAETAPLGAGGRSERSAMYPKRFLRELMCVKRSGKPYTGRSARLRRCGDFRRKGALQATGYAHHPYTKNLPPARRHRGRDALTMANISELGTLLDELAGTTGNLPSGLPLYLTEFGFETDPPDRHSGISPEDQATFNTLGERIAWGNPRVAAQSQFLLADVAPLKRHKKGSKAYWSTYQSGLFGLDGRPKPAAYAYALPFIATRAGTDPATGLPSFALWGQLRFLSNGVADVAQIQWRPRGSSGPWTSVGAPVAIDPLGYFTATRGAPSAAPGEWRALWSRPGGGVGLASRAATGD